MICLRCGHCCTKLFSIVVNDPEKGICDDNFSVNNSTRCKHLIGSIPGKYSCAIHHYKWYVNTPCYRHNCKDMWPGKECNLGRYVIDEHRKNKTGKDKKSGRS